jgi:poly-gamma-glutamate synthesis protein (capsule biosynthesis protein)
MGDKALTMLAVGDLILNEPKAESFFALSAPVLRSADVVVGQVEVPFTSRGVETHAEIIPNAPCDPRNMSALPYAGFNVVTLAGNHIWDSGAPGIEDTITGLRKYGIAVVGAGMNISEARSPAVIERNGTRIGFLSYNCIGPKQTWATPAKPGCAYVHIISHYELPIANPGGPPAVFTYAESQSLEAMVEDIRKLRPHCEVLVVVFHKGVILTPARIAMYERQVSHAAIDAGADLVLGHHAHILRGIEKYKGKAIFHGIGHFVVAMQNLTVDGAGSAVDTQQARRRLEELFGFEYDSDADPKALFPSDSKKTIIAKCVIDDGKITRASYLPCLINEEGQPEILKNDDRGRQVFAYMDKITQKAGLNARYEWEGDEVVIHAE